MDGLGLKSHWMKVIKQVILRKFEDKQLEEGFKTSNSKKI